MRRNIVIIGVGALLAGTGATVEASQTLFQQLPGLSDIRAQDATGSQPGSRHADNFSLSESASVTTVQWWGSYVPLDLVNPTSLDDFSVTFYSNTTNGSGQNIPGSILSEQQVTVTAVDTGNDIAGVVDQYLYTAILPTPVSFNANEVYWFAPLNNTGLGALPDTLASWGWEVTATNPAFTYAFFNLGLPNLGWRIENKNQNFSFRLVGVIPEPTSVAALGIVGLLGLGRRRR